MPQRRAGIGLLTLAVAVVVIASVAFATVAPAAKDTYLIRNASMFISDAGSSHGGFEFTASYNVSFTDIQIPGQQGVPRNVFLDSIVVSDGQGILMKFSLDIGLGDPLEVHELYLYFRYDSDSGSVTLGRDGTVFELVRVDQDLVWNHTYDGYYIASWGGFAPEEEIRGEISPGIFGLPEHYYIELRLQMSAGVPS